MDCTFLVVSFMLSSTRFGRYIYAVGGSERVSVYAGVPVRKIKFLVYLLSSALVCVASFVFLYKFANIAPGTGEGYLLDTIADPDNRRSLFVWWQRKIMEGGYGGIVFGDSDKLLASGRC